jgi:hypothetical protein
LCALKIEDFNHVMSRAAKNELASFT